MFWNKLREYGDNIAIIDSQNNLKITYLELNNDIEEFLDKWQTEELSVCLLLVDNDYFSLMSYLSLLQSNYIIMLLGDNISDEFLENITKNYSPEIIISQKDRKLVNYKKQNFITRKQNIFFYILSGIEQRKITSTKLMLSTSGSTGSSKFVRLSANNIQSNAESISQYLRITPKDRAITSLPMHYSFGLSIINSHLLSGASIILTKESLIQKNFWKIFNDYEATTFSGVPYSFQMLERIKFADMRLPSLKYFTQAGGHLVNTSKKYFVDTAIKKNYEFIVMYGQTEATARISYVPFNKLISKIDSIGISIPNGKLYLDIKETSKENVGELIYQGPNVMLGYAEIREDIFKDDELNGTLLTGDMGYQDNDGYFYVTGRKKRFLKVFGNRINLDDIERILENNFKIPCAVSGIDDKIFVVVEKTISEKIELIKKQLSTTLSLHHSSFTIKSIDKIPVSSNSKKDYQKINKIFQ